MGYLKITRCLLLCAILLFGNLAHGQSTYPTSCLNAQKQVAIQAIPKECRPDPSVYLSEACIKKHQKQFALGATYLIPKDVLDRFGRKLLGRADGQFVMCKKEMDKLLHKKNITIADIERTLGIPTDAWKGKVLVRIDIREPKKLNLRIPRGTEAGANNLWIPGGKLPTGYTEGVVDQVPEGSYVETVLSIK